MLLSQHALQVVTQHALQQGGACSEGGGCLLGGGGDPHRNRMAPVADGTHPTGMHSCLHLFHGFNAFLWHTSNQMTVR